VVKFTGLAPRNAGSPFFPMQLTDRVHLVGRSDWGGLPPLCAGFSCNVFLLDASSELALIDTGMPEGVEDIFSNIRRAGFDSARITKILITHAHWDHTASTAEMLKRIPAARVYGHPLTRATLAGEEGIYMPEYRPPQAPATVHHLLNEGDSLAVGDMKLQVLHTPGHTPDGLVFLFDTPAGRHAFTGDTAIGDQPNGRGVVGWFEWVWKSNLTDYIASMQRIRNLNLSAFFPGHGNSHLSRDPVQKSLDNCLARLMQLRNIPDLGTMMPEIV